MFSLKNPQDIKNLNYLISSILFKFLYISNVESSVLSHLVWLGKSKTIILSCVIIL